MSRADLAAVLIEALGEEAGRAALVALIAHFGGERIYIPRRPLPAAEVTARDTPRSLMARGVPRRTAYNWVTRWRK